MSERTHRTYKPRDIVVAFARQGVALDVIARSLVTSLEHVRLTAHRAFATGEILALPPETTVNSKSPLHAELTTLRETIERQGALIRELRADGLNTSNDMAFKLTGIRKFTGHEARLVAELMRRGRASKERLYFALYGNKHGSDQPDPKIIDVFVCKVRAKLPKDVKIETVRGAGYEMKPDSVARLRELAGITERAPSIVPRISEMAA